MRYGLRREKFGVCFLEGQFKEVKKLAAPGFDGFEHEDEGNECAFRPLHESVKLRIVSQFQFQSGLCVSTSGSVSFNCR